MKKLYLLFFAMLAGCATTAGYEAILNTWVGSSEENLISTWGAPQSTYELNGGGKILTYENRRNVQIGGIPITKPVTTYSNGTINGDVNANYSGTSTTYVQSTTPVQNIAMVCTTRFTVRNGIVQTWAWQGNACRAKAPDTDTDTTSASVEIVPKTELEVADKKYVDKDFLGAYTGYLKLAQQGNVNAEIQVGDMFFSGVGIVKDYSKAVYWYKKAAESGDNAAKKKVGIMYEIGLGVERSQSEADAWYKRAKENN